MVSEPSVLRPSSSVMDAQTKVDTSISLSDLKKLIVERLGTPWWISELSAMEDEVIGRTILLVVHYPAHQVNDFVIYRAFSEIGVIEDVRNLPAESGFHSRVRFRNKSDVDWVYRYFNGAFLPEGCCKLEIHRANDVISWDTKRVAGLKAVCGVNDTLVLKNDEPNPPNEPPNSVVVNPEMVAPKVFEEMPHSTDINKIDALLNEDDSLATGRLELDDVVIIDKELSQLEAIDESKIEKDAANLSAHQVFDEMSRVLDSPEMKTMNQIAKVVDDLLLLMASDKEGLSLKPLNVSDFEAAKALLVLKSELTDLVIVVAEFPIQGGITMDHVRVMSFDPGGIKVACVHCATVVLSGKYADFCCHFGADSGLGQANAKSMFQKLVLGSKPALIDYYVERFACPVSRNMRAALGRAESLMFDPGGQILRQFTELFKDELQFAKAILLLLIEHKEKASAVCSNEEKCNLQDSEVVDLKVVKFSAVLFSWLIRRDSCLYMGFYGERGKRGWYIGTCVLMWKRRLKVQRDLDGLLVHIFTTTVVCCQLMLHYLSCYILRAFLLILEDKDHFKRGVLMQENGIFRFMCFTRFNPVCIVILFQPVCSGLVHIFVSHRLPCIKAAYVSLAN